MLWYLPPPLPRELGCLRDKRHRKRWNPEKAEKRTDWPCVLPSLPFLWSHRISLRALFAKPMEGKARAGRLQESSRRRGTADTLVPPGLANSLYSRLPWRQRRRCSLGGAHIHPGEGNGTHSSTPAWRSPWPEEPGGRQSTGSQRAGHAWATSLSPSHTAQSSPPPSERLTTRLRSAIKALSSHRVVIYKAWGKAGTVGRGARAATVLMCAFPAPGRNPGLHSFLTAALTDCRTLHGPTPPMHHFTGQEATRPTRASLGQNRGAGGAASLLGA